MRLVRAKDVRTAKQSKQPYKDKNAAWRAAEQNKMTRTWRTSGVRNVERIDRARERAEQQHEVYVRQQLQRQEEAPKVSVIWISEQLERRRAPV